MHGAEKEKGLLIFLLDGKCTCIWSTMALCKSIYRLTSSCLETMAIHWGYYSEQSLKCYVGYIYRGDALYTSLC